jgi:hypothetical protein
MKKFTMVAGSALITGVVALGAPAAASAGVTKATPVHAALMADEQAPVVATGTVRDGGGDQMQLKLRDGYGGSAMWQPAGGHPEQITLAWFPSKDHSVVVIETGDGEDFLVPLATGTSDVSLNGQDGSLALRMADGS